MIALKYETLNLYITVKHEIDNQYAVLIPVPTPSHTQKR